MENEKMKFKHPFTQKSVHIHKIKIKNQGKTNTFFTLLRI